MYLSRLKPEEIKSLTNWWSRLDKNRGVRAQLRRASHPDDVLLTDAFYDFLSHMPSDWASNEQIRLTDAAMVAVILARVEVRDNKSFAKSLARPKNEGGTKPVMSGLRFQQLLKSRSRDDLFKGLCRAIDLLGRKANIESIADDILLWFSETRYGKSSNPMHQLAVRWASDYYINLKD